MIGAVGGDMPQLHTRGQGCVYQSTRAHCAARVNDNRHALKLFGCRPVGIVYLEGEAAFVCLDEIGVSAIESGRRAQVKDFHRS